MSFFKPYPIDLRAQLTRVCQYFNVIMAAASVDEVVAITFEKAVFIVL